MDYSTAEHGLTGLEGPLQQMKLKDCVLFLRTGTCAFGAKCRFNHPMAEKPPVVLPNNNVDELPERPGQMECQFFLKTGTCKFGSACWFRHPWPKNELGGDEQVQLNFLGLPLRPGEKECSYYVQTGSCKYGSACRFHHPQPTTAETVLPSPNSSVNAISGVTLPVQVPYQDGVTTWPAARAPYMPPAIGMPRPVNVIPPFIPSPQPISMTGSAPFKQQAQMYVIPSADRVPQVAATQGINDGQFQGHATTTTTGMKGFDTFFPKSTATFVHGQAIFPERPGQPDCHHYMKTGDCKFGMNCKYHHPKDRAMSLPSGLNPMGLPLRPGKQSCPYYVKHGICKFGPVCKFDHPLNVLPSSPPYSPSLSSLNEIPVAPFVPESSLISPNLTSSEGLYITTKSVGESQPSLPSLTYSM